MKIIFLDFDGVIVHPPYTGGRCCPSCVERVDRIASASGAKVVVSSSWRVDDNPNWIKAKLREFGLKADVIGQTPSHETVLASGLWIGGGRNEEIRSWLRANQDVEAFVVLDDEAVFDAGLVPHLVRTEYQVGLTDRHVGIALRKLEIVKMQGLRVKP